MLSLAFQKFPEVYAGGEAPAAIGARDTTRNLGTPPYVYGWIVPRHELYEALHGKPCPLDRLLDRIYIRAERKLYSFWTEKGYCSKEYNPDFPSVRPINVTYVVVFMACNDSDAIITSVMENKKYHEECRACLGNTKTMELEPAWFRVDLKNLPKGFPDALTVGDVDQ